MPAHGPGSSGSVAAALVGGVVGGLIGALLISEAFIRVIFPLSLPGVFAGSILTFIPAIGDYVNAELLGNPADPDDRQRHPEPLPGQNDYPTAAALSFILMAGDPRRDLHLRPGCWAPRSCGGRVDGATHRRPPSRRRRAARPGRGARRWSTAGCVPVFTVLAILAT